MIQRNDRVLARGGFAFLALVAVILPGEYFLGFPRKLGGLAFSLLACLFALFALAIAARHFKDPPPQVAENPLRVAVLWYAAFVLDAFLLICGIFVGVGIVGLVAGH